MDRGGIPVDVGEQYNKLSVWYIFGTSENIASECSSGMRNYVHRSCR